MERKSGYHHLEVDTRDNRKPLYEVPFGLTLTSIFKTFDEDTFISERTMFEEWVSKRGYLELNDNPYVPPFPIVKAGQTQLLEVGGEQEVEPHQRDFETSLHPLDLDEGVRRMGKDMARRCKRYQSFGDHWRTLLQCSLASFARMAQINIDSEQKIGPLLDYDQEYHK